MKGSIEVTSRKEAKQLRAGLVDPQVRAFVKIIGTLNGLESQRARERVLRFVDDHLDETQADYVSVFR